MFIKISNLSDGEHEFDFNEPVKELELGEPFYGDIVLKAKLSKLNNQFILKTEFEIHAKLICDRCGTEYDKLLNNSYQMVYILGKQQEDNESNFNVSYLSLNENKIYLDNDVRDYSILAVPMKKLCKEDCKGLCYKCGQDLNKGDCDCSGEEVDTRWAPLLNLRNKLSNN